MRVRLTILYFAAVRDLVGTSEEELQAPPSVTTIALLAAHLTNVHPELAGRLENVRFARNEELAKSQDPIASGDTVALIPPVAGG